MYQQLKSSIESKYLFENETLANYTSFKIGGKADIILKPDSILKLQEYITLLQKLSLRFMVVGGGNNILFSDNGYRGVIVLTTNLKNLSHQKDIVSAECGVKLDKLSDYALNHNLSGLEFSCGIPGTVGGAIFMNAGAYGGEMKNVVKEVTYLDQNLIIKTNTQERHNFSYRNSYYQQNSLIVLKITFKLNLLEENSEIEETIKELTHKREDKQPLEYPSAGSIFRRPEGHFTGKLIDDCGLRGYSIGGAQISTKHAGFIVNKGGATAKDVLNLIKHIQTTVFNNYKVNLKTEVRIIEERI